jgi:hypothetical protein
LHDLGILVLFPAELRDFLLSETSRLTLRPTEPYIRWIPGALSFPIKAPEREADHSYLVSRLRLSGASGGETVPLDSAARWGSIGQGAPKRAEY